MRRAFFLGTIVSAQVLSQAACGGTAASPSPPGGGANDPRTITISASRVTPASITVPAGSRVTFANRDTRAHNMTSDPHPEHSDCPEINTVGALAPGQSRETGNLVAVRTCGFHDHDEPTNAALSGRIVVQ